MVEAPTGSGKSLLAEMVRHELGVRGLFLCSTIQLQSQFAADFPYSSVLKGRRNYTPEYIDPARNWEKISCEDCNGTPPSKANCTLCEKRGTCPYEIEKTKAYRAKVAVLNTSYFLHEANGVDKGIGRSRGFVVVDEADLLERELLGYVEFRISDSIIRDFRLQPPKKGSHKSTITAWLEELAGQVNWWLQCHELPVGEEAARDVNGLRKYKRNEKLEISLARVLSGDLDDNWVRDNEAGPLVLKPVHVKAWTGEMGGSGGKTGMLWRHSRQVFPHEFGMELPAEYSYTDEGNIEVPGKWLLMSGTIIAPDLYMKALGKQPGEFEFVSVASTFPVENRPIYMTNAADMTMKGGQEKGGWRNAAKALLYIAKHHPGQRILVHTVSYKLARFLMDAANKMAEEETRERFCVYLSADDRADALQRFTTERGCILIAASMDRGVDFAGDLCEIIVVAKLPYPYLGDPQTNARMRNKEEGLGQTWYILETGRTLVQMTGRGVRSETDKCVTYILDSMAPQFLKQTFATPAWWRAGIDRTFNAAKWRREVGS